MDDPQQILRRARLGSVPSTWIVFTGKRGAIRGFFTRTSGDANPLVVVTPDGVVEYRNERKPVTVVVFDHLVDLALRARASTMSDSMHATLSVWLDLRYRDGRTVKWQAPFVDDGLRVVQSVIEAYGAHKARHGRGTT